MPGFRIAIVCRTLAGPQKHAAALSSASILTLTAMMAGPALAGTYHATDDASLRAAIASAQGDADPSGTIILDNDITMVSGFGNQLPGNTKPITIDTNGHTYTEGYQNGSTVSGAVNLNGTPSGSIFILNGNFQAASAGAGVNGNGDQGLFSNGNKTVTNHGSITGGAGGGLGGNGGAGVGLIQNGASLTNTGTITGGGAVNGVGGIGVNLSSGASLSNSGTIRGGDGGSGNGGMGVSTQGVPSKTIINSGLIQGGNSTTASGGTGVRLIQGNALDNSDTITGGNGVNGGWGVDINGLNAANPIFNNSGTIRGGNGTTGPGNAGVIVRTNVGPMTNSGSIIGGANSLAAIMNTGVLGATNVPINLINSGTITAGTGSDTAILMQTPSNLTLELRKGSVITGKVIGDAGAASNALILGGDEDYSFDVSAVGPQYQNFTSFQKTGNSVWTLIGTGTVATPWTIGAGTLQMGDGASMIGDVTDNATLAFNGSTTFANVITGTGGVTKSGTGITNLTGASTYTGPTTVSGGRLSVNGSITSAVTVQTGGTLGGNGTVGATTVQSGGNIAPGNSIGTLHINGAFVQSAGSVYQVEIDPTSSASDLIQVNGTATLQSGAGLNVTKNLVGEYQLGTVYRVLTATGGLTGTYAVTGQTTGVSAFLGLRDSYDANNAYLTVVQTQPLTNVATTPNQQQVASAVQALPQSNPVQTAVLNLPDAPTAQSAFDQLSASALAPAQGALVSNALYVRDVSFDRLRDVTCAPGSEAQNRPAGCMSDLPSLWGQGFGGWGGVAGNANASGLNHSAAGMLVGVDVPVLDWRLGVFGGFSRSDFHLVGNNAGGESNDYHLGAYGGTLLGDVALRLGASYSWDGITTNRAVAFGTFTDQLRAVYSAGTTQVFGELGYRVGMEQLSLEPFANLTYVGLTTAGFTEAGGPAALTVRANTTENMIATLGLRPSMDVDLGGLSGTLRGMLGWRRTFGTVTPDTQVSFAGGNVFGITGVPMARNAAAVEAGLDVTVAEGMTVGLTYGGQFSNRSTDQSARGTIRISF